MTRYLSTTASKQGSKAAQHQIGGGPDPMTICRWRRGNGTAGFSAKDSGARNTGAINLHNSSRQIAWADCAFGATSFDAVGVGVASFGAIGFGYRGNGNLSAHRIDRPILGLLGQFILEQHLDRDGWRRSGRYSGTSRCSPVPRED